MKFRLLGHSVENFRRFREIFVVGGSAYSSFDIHTKMGYQGSSTKRATRLQDTLLLIEGQQAG